MSNVDSKDCSVGMDWDTGHPGRSAYGRWVVLLYETGGYGIHLWSHEVERKGGLDVVGHFVLPSREEWHELWRAVELPGFARQKELFRCKVSVRLANILDKLGLRTLGELEAVSPEKVLELSRPGWKPVKEAQQLLLEHGLGWDEYPRVLKRKVNHG